MRSNHTFLKYSRQQFCYNNLIVIGNNDATSRFSVIIISDYDLSSIHIIVTIACSFAARYNDMEFTGRTGQTLVGGSCGSTRGTRCMTVCKRK